MRGGRCHRGLLGWCVACPHVITYAKSARTLSRAGDSGPVIAVASGALQGVRSLPSTHGRTHWDGSFLVTQDATHVRVRQKAQISQLKHMTLGLRAQLRPIAEWQALTKRRTLRVHLSTSRFCKACVHAPAPRSNLAAQQYWQLSLRCTCDCWRQRQRHSVAWRAPCKE